MNKYFIEFLGTFFLVLVIALTGNPMAIGAILIAMVYMGGYISGAHYNPAVTAAVFVRGKMSRDVALRYILAQLAGGLVAAFVVDVLTARLFVPVPASTAGFYQALLTEFLFTFALGSVVLHVATSDRVKGNYYYGLAIGFTLMAAIFAGGAISGGVYNPAVAVGPIIADIVNINTNLPNLALYILGPMLGGIAAGFAYKQVQE